MTPLHWAAQYGLLAVVECLVNHKADLNLRNNDGKTPICLSSENGYKKVTKFLKNNGAISDCRI